MFIKNRWLQVNHHKHNSQRKYILQRYHHTPYYYSIIIDIKREVDIKLFCWCILLVPVVRLAFRFGRHVRLEIIVEHSSI